MDEAEARERIDVIARSWISTPYHDHGRVKGAGVDCAQLLLATFAEAGLIPETDVGYYAPQQFLHQKEERFLGWVQRFGREIPLERALPGDIALYKLGLCFAHGAIIVKPGWPTIIHAHAAGRVVRRANGLNPHLGKVLDLKFFTLF